MVVAEGACVAVEAMEGTDATIERAGQIMASLEADGFDVESLFDGGQNFEAESGYAV